MDEVVYKYRKVAGQRLRRSARSISLEEKDTTDKNGEVKDAENSKNNSDLDDDTKLRILIKEVENL
jgi:hypothetical protein